MKDSPANKLGELLILRIDAERWTPSLERLLRAARPAGILLPHLSNPDHTAELLRKIASVLPGPPLLMLEEEGGEVDPLRAILPSLPPPQAAAERGRAVVAELGELIGEALSLLGFNTNLAPLLDLATPAGGSICPTRTFGADPQAVAQCGQAFLRGLERHKVLACGKYFPGLSGAEVDKHAKLPKVGKTMAGLWRQDLVPYRELHAHLPLVMVGHGAYKAYDFNVPRPAILSSNILDGLLRVKLGYEGLAVADDLCAEPIRSALEPAEAAVKAINAGCDLVLIGRCDGRTLEAVRRSLETSLESGGLLLHRVVEALRRLRTLRRRLRLPRGTVSQRALKRLARKFEEFGKTFGPAEIMYV